MFSTMYLVNKDYQCEEEQETVFRQVFLELLSIRDCGSKIACISFTYGVYPRNSSLIIHPYSP